MFVYTVGIVLGLELIHPTSSGRMGNDSPPEQLPHPKETVRELQKPVFEMFPYERINRYEVWQYYGVDRQGTWRPRVIILPGGHITFTMANRIPSPRSGL
jgi:hypothetical protein